MNKNPQAFIAKNNNRFKVYNPGTVYIDDGTEFQLEFWNPTDKTILAKFSFNGEDNSMGTGLILRPAERVWLDRYLNKEKKFKFETYKFENNKQGRDATRNNGLVSISFFKEKNPNHCIRRYWSRGWQSYNPSWTYDASAYTYKPGTLPPKYGSIEFISHITGPCFDGTVFTTDSVNTNYKVDENLVSGNMSANVFNCNAKLNEPKQSSNLDVTGRVSIGSHSDQKLTDIDMEFEVFSFYNIEYKIKPIEKKTSGNVTTYCTSCGYRKRKSQWKVCPICGNKFEF